MAKELPYFKFEPNEWENGNIQMLTHEEKGIFIDLCSLYWSRLGEVPYRLALRKVCGGNAVALKSLCEENIIDVIDEYIYIGFLQEQLDDFKRIKQQNSENAKKRWSKKLDNKGNDAGALPSQSERNAIREEKRREEERREEEKNILKKKESEFNNDYSPPSMKVSDVVKVEEVDYEQLDEIQNDFENWFKAYDNNAGKMQAQREWSQLTDKERKKCLDVVQDYTKKTPKRWRKKPNNYLSEKVFNDEIIDRTKSDDNGKGNKFNKSIQQAKEYFEKGELGF
jgi:hypothetical protein